jgi:cell division protein FtsB
VSALRGSLKKDIDRAIKSGGEEGFQVSFEDIKEITSRAKAGDQPLKPGMEKKQIGRTSDELKDQLANDLEKYCLPRPESEAQPIVPLVVVTGIQAREALEKAGVWRSLSSLIDSNSKGWEELGNYGNKAPSNFLNFFIASFQEISKRLVLVLLVISLGFNIWLLQQLMFQGELQEQNKNLRNEQKELQEKNGNFRSENKRLETEIKQKLEQADAIRRIWENATNQMQEVLKSNTSLEVIK